ncbi:ATP-binding protein [Achromobacter xylosoxidans]|uniref:ATP-binding protein n=1 Tax=Achromobacter TaxID=222 RepID=UPI0008BF5719|nr:MULTISPECIES: ATP-binding protein [Achromobacter]OFU67458.1 hybrid sensor histidine kinase/response regulator [Achromobacter xylosoxidans]PWY42552.1 hybrid sensor histidine kinase/response regulator [Achromobacter sp. RW408]
MLLLHMFAVALAACILVGTALYAYGAFTGEVSKYRRRMNAGAYTAQLYFDQRESLLRSVAASAVRNTDRMSVADTPRTFGATGQISVAPLVDAGGTYEWALILTPRDRANVAQLRAHVVYASPANATVTRLSLRSDAGATPMSDATARWLAQALRLRSAQPGPDGRNPIVWLRPPMDEANRLFLYTPADVTGDERTWIGLEVGGLGAVVGETECASGGAGYALYDGNGAMALHGGTLPPRVEETPAYLSSDSFRLRGESWWPQTLVLVKSVGEAGWRLAYYVPIGDLLEDGAVAFWTAGAVAALLIVIVLLAVRHIRNRLVKPALRQYEALVDSVALNRKIVDVAPVGLCLLRRKDGELLLSNAAARQWLGEQDHWRQALLGAGIETGGGEYTLKDGRSAYVAFAATTYQSEDVVLCGISDITAQKKVEHALRQAKLATDRASESKAMFFATISHEIRTPLYGILGTLELLALTGLTGQQEQYLNTIQQSSSTLLRTINGTLDLSRIEAGHEELEISAFSPADLVEQVVANYAARARAKGLDVYAITEVGMPASALGDSIRILQILNNLVSNAVKFTEAGRVVLRASATAEGPGRTHLRFQVADTGPGICETHRARLFEPYFRAPAAQDCDVAGTGLGLTICRRLSDLMGGSLSVVSEEGLGTSILFSLTLDTDEQAAAPPLTLQPRPVYVDGAVPEVVDNVRGWLAACGANALPYRRQADGVEPDGAVLVQTWPPAVPEPRWKHQRVRVLAPGAGQGAFMAATGGAGVASAFNPVSICRAVQMAQDGVEPGALGADGAKQGPLDLRILVVEDNVINQLILREQLEHLGCAVTLAGNGEEALQRWRRERFDLVLTDLNMPVVNGYELARALREGGYDGPLIGLTSSSAAEIAQRGVAAGMTQVLCKPLPFMVLAQTLHGIAKDMK